MKININIENYGAYWIDYLDGNINSEQEEALFAFLESNPEIAGNLIDPEDYALPIIETKYPGKSNLRSENQTENLLIAKIENEISVENDAFITKEINENPKVAQSYSIYKKTILLADSSIVFPDKESLKKTVRVPMFRYIGSIAAAIAIVFVAGYFLTRDVDVNTNGTKPLTSGLEFMIPDVRINNDSSTHNNLVEDVNSIEYTANNVINSTTNNAGEFNSPVILEIPEKIPLRKANSITAQETFSSAEIMEYRYDLPTDNMAFNYTMQYQKTNDDSRFVAGFKKLVKFGKDVNLSEKWDDIKIAKEEILYTSIDK